VGKVRVFLICQKHGSHLYSLNTECSLFTQHTPYNPLAMLAPALVLHDVADICVLTVTRSLR